ncbi:MAG: L-seryl-tRNA(Sec) selenium transferase [Archangium sp.]|nr:L-seryl-tRNA(Sec) selenium transferase [Archangium sp.]
MDDSTRMERLRALPSIDELLARPSVSSLLAPHSRNLGVTAVREAVASLRARILNGEDVRFDEKDIAAALARLSGPKLKRVINATGVVLHTNLGRAPLHAAAIDRIAQIAAGYSNLEFDLDEGERGSRYQPVVELLCALTGAEDAMVVNNCAASVLLIASALGNGREVIVSRGEAVEIGGGFRIPDVMRQSGAGMIEVGTTNRTRLDDYANAITDQTALLIKVHRSNFALVGFQEEVTVRELAKLGHERAVLTYVDLGSGLAKPLHGEGLSGEATVASVVAQGADVVSFSGDKLLGGPQAGVIVGKRDVLARLKKHPLNRALRIDKLTVAALEATLELYRDGREDELPVRAALTASLETLHIRATRLALLLGTGVKHRVVETRGRVGGGSMPLADPPSWAVVLEGAGATIHDKLRAGETPVVGRIADDEVWLDVRCVADTELEALAAAVRNLKW